MIGWPLPSAFPTLLPPRDDHADIESPCCLAHRVPVGPLPNGVDESHHTTVKQVDLKRFMGDCYVIANIP